VEVTPMIDHGSSTARPARMGRLATGCCSWLVCSPPRLAADTRAKRFADRVLPRPGWPAAVYFAVAVALLALAPRLSTRWGLVVTAIACLGGGGWCAVNFWRCRHAHCLVTGAGWLALGGLAVAGVIVGHSVIGGTERLVFLAVLAAGVLFEAVTYQARGSYALTPPGPSIGVRMGR
jgi:hypothetical protein